MTTARKTVAIDFFADLTCPWCYVAWEALKAGALLAPEVSCSVRWRAFLLHPGMPAGGVSRLEMFSPENGFDPERLARARAALMDAAEATGAPLNLDAPERVPPTLDAQRLIHWTAAAGAGESAIDALFGAYWVQGRDLGDHAVLSDIASGLGFDAQEALTLLASDDDCDDIRAQHGAAVKLGLEGVPVAIFNQKAVLMGAEPPAAYAQALRACADQGHR